ncbi:MAG: hypothetical protein AB8G23_07975 [Myxococcota bacterium]
MQPNQSFFFGDRRRLVNLSTQPIFQLKLPIGLLLISSGFALVFAAHTHAAYGRLISAGFEDAFLSELAAEISFDYLVVSGALGLAWCLTILGVCLTVTHRFLGPIVALRRRISQIKAGQYEQRALIRENHPLRAVGDELDALARLLSGEDLAVLEANAKPIAADIQAAQKAETSLEEGVLQTELLPSEEGSREAMDIETADHTSHPTTPWVGWYARTATGTGTATATAE